jgi:invasion protein IalB
MHIQGHSWCVVKGLAAALLASTLIAKAPPVLAQTAQNIWGVNCAGSVDGLDCRAVNVLPMTQTSILSLAVRLNRETGKPELLMVAPLGIYLPAGIALKFGEAEPKAIAFVNCDNSGCLAQYAITPAELQGLSDGETFTVWVRDMSREAITVRVPATGFATAFAMVK